MIELLRDLFFFESQGVELVHGTGVMKGPHSVSVDTGEGVLEYDADAVLVCTGSRPRIPDWCNPDGDRVLTTRQAYPPPEATGDGLARSWRGRRD